LAWFQDNFVEVPFRVVFKAGEKIKTITGMAIVSSVTQGAEASQLAAGNVTLLVKGQPVYADAFPETVNLTLIMTGNDSVTALTKFRLLNDAAEIIFQTDILPQSSGGWLSNPFNITVPVPKGNFYYYFTTDVNGINNEFSLDAPPTASVPFDNGVVTKTSYDTQTFDFTADRTATFTLSVPLPPPTCVPPTIGTDMVPVATVGVPYLASIPLNGSQPFTVTDISKPSWLDMNITGGNILLLTGTPTSAGTFDLLFTVSNACGSASFNGSIDVVEASGASTVNYSLNTGLTVGYRLRIFVNGSLRDELSVTSSGSTTVVSGDVVEAQLIGVSIAPKHLIVTNVTTSTVLYDNLSTSTQDFSFTAAGSTTYSIQGSHS
jgi:hypothetical protein